jgi:ABC transporter DrrB family efflux protein
VSAWKSPSRTHLEATRRRPRWHRWLTSPPRSRERRCLRPSTAVAESSSRRSSGIPYPEFLIPGIIVQNIAFGGFVTALGLNEDVHKGLIDRFRSLPMARPAVLAGRTLSDVVTNLLSVVVLVVTGLIIGFSFHASALDVIAGFGLLLLFGYAFSWVFALVGLLVSSPESANSAGFIAVFPLTFISSAFVPVHSMPSVLRAFANVNPFTIVVDAMRHLWIGTPAGNYVWGSVVWALVIIAVFAPLAVGRYRRATAH